jgi:hypothetical protein
MVVEGMDQNMTAMRNVSLVLLAVVSVCACKGKSTEGKPSRAKCEEMVTHLKRVAEATKLFSLTDDMAKNEAEKKKKRAEWAASWRKRCAKDLTRKQVECILKAHDMTAVAKCENGS